jgi:hypothetical protein
MVRIPVIVVGDDAVVVHSQDREQRRLATPRRPRDGDVVALLNVEVQPESACVSTSSV